MVLRKLWQCRSVHCACHSLRRSGRRCVACRFVLRDVKTFVEKQPGAWAPSRLFTAGSRQATAHTLQDKLEEFLKELQVCRLVPPPPPLSPPPPRASQRTFSRTFQRTFFKSDGKHWTLGCTTSELTARPEPAALCVFCLLCGMHLLAT